MKIEYQLFSRDELDDEVRLTFSKMLRKQGKVREPLENKADRCRYLCIAKVDGSAVAIGAIKPKTSSDFSGSKSGLTELKIAFEWELGYLYTEPDYERQGFASNIVRLLTRSFGNGNLMASTEVSANVGMVRILERSGFRFFGKPWKSGIHDDYLGLFLRFGWKDYARETSAGDGE